MNRALHYLRAIVMSYDGECYNESTVKLYGATKMIRFITTPCY